MVSLKERSYEKELLDLEGNSFADIRKNMNELDTINTYLGGHSITINGFRQLVKHSDSNGPLYVVEIGCGGGDNLRVIKNWASKNNIKVQLTGVDINPDCITYAKNRMDNKGIDFITSDYRDAYFERRPDIMFSSLFCHHFNDDELVAQLTYMKENTRLGFFINDLHRHGLAYHSIRWITRFFSKSHLVKHDAPLSVRRGFIKNEWEKYFQQAALKNYHLKWKWAFRWLIIYVHANS